MTFEERLRAAIEDKYCEEILTELTGIPKVYQIVDNILIRLSREVNHLNLYVKDDYNIVIKYKQNNGIIKTETVFFSECDVDLSSPNCSMDGGRLLYYIYESHINERGIKITPYTETNDGDNEYPGLKVEFVRKEVLKPLNERIQDVRNYINNVENKDATWKKIIAAAVIDIAEEKLNDDILRLVAAGKKEAVICIIDNTILLTDEITKIDDSKVKYYGISVKVPENLPKKFINLLDSSLDNIVRDEIKTILLNYYTEQGIDIFELTKKYWEIGKNEVILKLNL